MDLDIQLGREQVNFKILKGEGHCKAVWPNGCPFFLANTVSIKYTYLASQVVTVGKEDQIISPKALFPLLITNQRCPFDYRNAEKLTCPANYAFMDTCTFPKNKVILSVAHFPRKMH